MIYFNTFDISILRSTTIQNIVDYEIKKARCYLYILIKSVFQFIEIIKNKDSFWF